MDTIIGYRITVCYVVQSGLFVCYIMVRKRNSLWNDSAVCFLLDQLSWELYCNSSVTQQSMCTRTNYHDTALILLCMFSIERPIIKPTIHYN